MSLDYTTYNAHEATQLNKLHVLGIVIGPMSILA